jgi:hypothetical protein
MRGDSAGVFGVAPVLRILRVTPSTQAEKFVASAHRSPDWAFTISEMGPSSDAPANTIVFKGKRFQSWLRFRVHGN